MRRRATPRRPRSGTVGDSPDSDIVTAWGMRSCQPPTQNPFCPSAFSPLVGGLTLHSCGWMFGQWKHSW